MCPGCNAGLDFSAWDLLPGANFPAFCRCTRCLRRIHLPEWWHVLTLLLVMVLGVFVPLLVLDIRGLLPALALFALVYAVLSISLSALYIGLGGRLVVEEFR